MNTTYKLQQCFQSTEKERYKERERDTDGPAFVFVPAFGAFKGLVICAESGRGKEGRRRERTTAGMFHLQE